MFRSVRIMVDYTVKIILKVGLGVVVCILAVQTGIITPKVQNRVSSLICLFPLLLVGFVMFHPLPVALGFMFFFFKLLPKIF